MDKQTMKFIGIIGSAMFATAIAVLGVHSMISVQNEPILKDLARKENKINEIENLSIEVMTGMRNLIKSVDKNTKSNEETLKTFIQHIDGH